MSDQDAELRDRFACAAMSGLVQARESRLTATVEKSTFDPEVEIRKLAETAYTDCGNRCEGFHHNRQFLSL